MPAEHCRLPQAADARAITQRTIANVTTFFQTESRSPRANRPELYRLSNFSSTLGLYEHHAWLCARYLCLHVHYLWLYAHCLWMHLLVRGRVFIVRG